MSKKRAKKGKHSLPSEVKLILEQAVREPKVDLETARKISREFHRRFKGRKFPDTLELIREGRLR